MRNFYWKNWLLLLMFSQELCIVYKKVHPKFEKICAWKLWEDYTKVKLNNNLNNGAKIIRDMSSLYEIRIGHLINRTEIHCISASLIY